jgi:hypothetical protein
MAEGFKLAQLERPTSLIINDPSGRAVLVLHADGRVTSDPDLKADDAARALIDVLTRCGWLALSGWKPVDDGARDGSSWPVAWPNGDNGIGRYRRGMWEILASGPVVGFVRTAEGPSLYFDLPDPPVSESGGT